MPTRKHWLIGRLVGIILATVTVVAHADDPDLGSVDDMLNGQWTINPVDDLVAANPVQTSAFSANNYWFYTDNNKIQTQQPTQTVVTVNCSQSAPLPQQTRLRRMFDLKNDVIITLTPDASNCNIFRVQVLDPGSRASTQLPVQGSSVFWLQAVMGDFNHDGYEELVAMTERTMYLIVPIDVTNLSKGLQVVATMALPVDVVFNKALPLAKALSQPVIGDFDNDGVPEVAWVGAPGPGGAFPAAGTVKVFFASVCLQPNALCTGTTLTRRSTTITLGNSTSNVDDNTRYCASTSALAAGDFFLGASGGSDLLIAFTTTNEAGKPAYCRLALSSYTFDDNLTPQRRDQQDNVFAPDANVRDNLPVFAATARLDWFGGDSDQAVVAMSGYDRYCPAIDNCPYDQNIIYFSRRVILAVTFDDNGTMTLNTAELKKDHQTADFWGLAVGRFNNVTDDANQYNPRIAVLTAERTNRPNTEDSAYKPRVSFYSFASDFTPQTNPDDDHIVTGWQSLTFEQGFGNTLLQAGDLQGRSSLVGAPLVARIPDNWQTSVLLAMPPMHVDYVQIDGASQPAVVNFSVLTSTFNATYNTSETQTDQSSNTRTTSYTNAFAESIDVKGKTTFGVAGPQVDVSVKQSFEQTYKKTTTKNYNTYATTKFDVSTTTSFSDVVWFSRSDFNIYYYPVIGQKVCPPEIPNCTPAEQKQVYDVLSGPSNTTDFSAAGATQEWYQPVHQPGNIFTYPWNQAQLENNAGGDWCSCRRGGPFIPMGSRAATRPPGVPGRVARRQSATPKTFPIRPKPV